MPNENQERIHLNIQIKLYINSKLFEKGIITQEMFQQANLLILKQNT